MKSYINIAFLALLFSVFYSCNSEEKNHEVKSVDDFSDSTIRNSQVLNNDMPVKQSQEAPFEMAKKAILTGTYIYENNN